MHLIYEPIYPIIQGVIGKVKTEINYLVPIGNERLLLYDICKIKIPN
jgi:hypothetical protein